MCWYVVDVMDGVTFRIMQTWSWQDHRGNGVRALGYNPPRLDQPGGQAAKMRLARLILGQQVTSGEPIGVIDGLLVCPVYYEGIDLVDYFVQYKQEPAQTR